MNRNKVYFNWSSGKDSALALHYLLQDKNYSVEYLLTSVNAHHNRVSMHGLRTELLYLQTETIDIPCGIIELPEHPNNAQYESLMTKAVQQLKVDGFEYAAFGDIFLEDLRKYREQQLQRLNIKTVFPLWKKDTKQIIREFIDLGFKAIVICANADLLDQSFVGRQIDNDFINDLPSGVDPCGENGEFHTFCFDAPFFKQEVSFLIGETVLREYKNGDTTSRFWFCDLVTKKTQV